MTLFNVYSFDYECPNLLFQTFDRSKAEKFVESGNAVEGLIDNYFRPFFFTETNLDSVESKADEYISKCSKKLLLTIQINKKSKVRQLICSEFKQVHEDDFYNNEWVDKFDDYSIYHLVLSSNSIPNNLNSDEITEKIIAIDELDKEN